jgi:hypothetical protein
MIQKFPFLCCNQCFFDVFRAHNLFQGVHPARSSATIIAVVASIRFIFALMCLFVSVYISADR